MRCPRCEAEIPDSATFCNRCGFSTRQGAVAAFSYLPAGTPAWPTTPLPRSQASAPMIQSTGAPAAEGKARRSTASILLTIVLLISAAVLGTGLTLLSLYTQGQFTQAPPPKPVTLPQATPAPQATPTTITQGENQLPTPSSFKQISSTDVNASLQYPSDWQVEPAQKAQNLTAIEIHPAPTQQLEIDFIVQQFSKNVSSQVTKADEINQAIFESFSKQQGIQVTTVSSKQPTIAGITWSESDGTFTGNGKKYNIVSISAQHNGIYYSIIYLIPDAYYTEAVNKYIKHMLDTFQFLS